ncbi:hypothetical protein KIH39_15960 [Telmatocola sphagniphila]|uniref:Uncharacterized protein n=1 Tax=Telmatocola sphagniphila TaxID=1123043 RepID=A0A8E6B1L2_9BACT|nr:hypothetical protein [Telmatocola sphagniphila]QVL30345.1 hypothetical protein KIH39_15960 [Telmatocola sphagniphila]
MSTERLKNIELRIRRQRGRLLKADWLKSLNKACGFEFSEKLFLTLEHTEELKIAFFKKVKNENAQSSNHWSKSEIAKILSGLFGLSKTLMSTEVILFSSIDQFVGGIRVPAGLILRNLLPVWQLVNEDFAMTTEDVEHGICLEENPYTETGEYVNYGQYQITSWGFFNSISKYI